jgi:Zn-dependent protease
MAMQLGDDTAYLLGHLTLNPMKQMGPTSLIMLLLLGVAWGSVPVSLRQLRTRAGMALVSMAGPLSNLLLCLVFAGFTTAFGAFLGGPDTPVAQLMWAGCAANGVLFLFNMLPVPMLDGWSVFSLFIPAMRNLHPQQAQNLSWLFLLAVFMTPLNGLVWEGGGLISGAAITAWAGFFSLFS